MSDAHAFTLAEIEATAAAVEQQGHHMRDWDPFSGRYTKPHCCLCGDHAPWPCPPIRLLAIVNALAKEVHNSTR